MMGHMAGVRRRVRLPDPERQAGAAVELLGLLQASTADGVLSDEEINEIHKWLKSRAAGELPCLEYLQPVLEHVLRDGKITDAERKEVFRAVERILPPELRERAKQRRRAHETIEKLRRQEQAEQARTAAFVNEPILQLDFPVVGVPYENRHAVIRRFAKPNCPVYLVREPTNRYDNNAVMVLLAEGYQIGYVPREDAEVLAPQLDTGCKQKAWIKKVIPGSRYLTPYVLAEIYHRETVVTGALAFEELPRPRKPPWRVRHAKLMWGALLLVFFLLLARSCA